VLPIECRIPYSLEMKTALLRVCVPMMRELGEAAVAYPEGNSWELGGPAGRAASAIKVAEWVEWTFTGYAGEHEPVIVAPPEELLAAIDHLEQFIDRRFHDLGVKQACAGDKRGGDAVKVIVAVPVEHVEAVQQLVEAQTVCEALRRGVDAQVALWTVDRERRDQLQPQVAEALTFYAAELHDALTQADSLLARSHGESCADLIVALDRLDWDADDPQENTFGVPAESVLEQLVESNSSTAAELLKVLRGDHEEED